MIDHKIDHLASYERTWDSTQSGTCPKVVSNLIKMTRTPGEVLNVQKLEEVTTFVHAYMWPS